LVLKGSEPFTGLTLGTLMDVDVFQEAVPAIAFAVADGVAVVHFF